MTTLSIIKTADPRTWLLQTDRQAVASLQIGRAGVTGGKLRTAEGVWSIVRDRRRWWQITVGTAEPIVKLGRDSATIRGQRDPVPWETRGRFSRFHAILGAYRQTIVLDVNGWRAPTAEVQIDGTWEHRDLVVLTCFFALMARRRRSIILLSNS